MSPNVDCVQPRSAAGNFLCVLIMYVCLLCVHCLTCSLVSARFHVLIVGVLYSHADSALGHHSHLFHAWSGPPRRTKGEKVSDEGNYIL